MDYERYLNETGIGRKPSPIRAQHAKLVCLEPEDDAIYLTGGLPNHSTFPAVKATFQLRDGSSIELDHNATKDALQYDATPGFKELLNWIYELQRRVHNPPTYNNDKHPGEMKCIMTNGAQHGLSLVMENLVCKDDICLMESPAYAGAIAVLNHLKPKMIPIDTDKHGIIPSELRKVLSRWNPSTIQHPGKDGPKLLYCVPTCGNPTGASLTLERKKEIYELAREYKFLIIEDDPYFYLRSKPYVPSFLSIDTDGLVLRMDSVSKVVSAGIRIGVLTGPAPLIDTFRCNIETSVQHTSGLSQQFLLALLKKWGYEGFFANADKMATFYEKRKYECLEAARNHLQDVAEWNEPAGGMFLWIKLKVKDAHPVVEKLIQEKNVFVAPGWYFILDSKPCPYIRVSFSNTTYENMNKAFESLAQVIKKYKSENE
ncbi:kynurenine/alpha-aminoadipate aminotransferase, mitochondrial-like [Mytilus edulis]|uniref:kynurenine/alpha-aminoadipate aminotransferase, mitochondrial-like n=1 Tax=Mytilus edulis TaxID=6550 RepID=UPI0039EF92C8